MAGPNGSAETRQSRFLTALLAPLPPKEEQAASNRFIATLTDQMKLRWELGMRDVDDALREQTRRFHMFACRSVERDEGDAAYLASCHRQMLIPAPNRAALRWKKNGRKHAGGCDAWEAAIGRDEAWIGEHL